MSGVVAKNSIFRVVLDTNIFLRARIRNGNIPGQVPDSWKEEKFILVTS
ncbi:hypothetical protein JW964_05555 [candidate division KSB1 bacterium]|nr:hypothetical protein [candidate division KSB1 bacterium]